MLELRRVQILATLAVEGTMTATAARLHLTTSAVSQQVALLEKEVGLPLLVRSGRNVILNEAGHALVGHYAQIAEAVEEAEAHLRTFHSDVRGSLAISTFPSFCSVVLPEALMELRRDHPGLSTYVRDLEPLESIAQLRGGGIDIAVVDDVHDLELDGIVTVELGRDEVLLCASPEARTATASTRRLSSWTPASRLSLLPPFSQRSTPTIQSGSSSSSSAGAASATSSSKLA